MCSLREKTNERQKYKVKNMDEIDWIKQIKKAFKYFNIAFLAYVMLWLIIILVQFIIYKNINIAALGNFGMMFLVIGISLNLIFILLYNILYYIYKLNYIKIDIGFNKEYLRELYKYYPPAIVSLIYDLKTEIYRDYTATILYLYTKKYVNISWLNKEVKINKGNNQEYSNLHKHELYVYDCVINKQKFDEEIFYQYILEDAKEKQLISEEDKKKKKSKIRFIEIMILIVLIYLTRISNNEIWRIFMAIILSAVIGSFIMFDMFAQNTAEKLNHYKLTKKGKEELKRIKAFKNFIKDYTLIEEKDIEHIQLLEEYIPYSLSLGETPQVEKYIKQNEIYRNLIYKGREN